MLSASFWLSHSMNSVLVMTIFRSVFEFSQFMNLDSKPLTKRQSKTSALWFRPLLHRRYKADFVLFL